MIRCMLRHTTMLLAAVLAALVLAPAPSAAEALTEDEKSLIKNKCTITINLRWVIVGRKIYAVFRASSKTEGFQQFSRCFNFCSVSIFNIRNRYPGESVKEICHLISWIPSIRMNRT